MAYLHRRPNTRIKLHSLLLSAFLMLTQTVQAAGLQVTPIGLSLSAVQPADGLWLSNTGETPINTQIRVFLWTQVSGEDRLTPSNELVVSPPMMQLAAGERQLVRVIHTGKLSSEPAGTERAYRLKIDELPLPLVGAPKGLQFVLNYSLPVFVQPSSGMAPGPILQWSLKRDGEQTVLQVRNSGPAHAQLAAVSFLQSSGNRYDITPGLLGYVLPGSIMRWVLKSPASAFVGGGTLEVMINGEQSKQPLSLLADPSR